jgi:hypothetical protein
MVATSLLGEAKCPVRVWAAWLNNYAFPVRQAQSGKKHLVSIYFLLGFFADSQAKYSSAKISAAYSKADLMF